jgi:hypothetical protein
MLLEELRILMNDPSITSEKLDAIYPIYCLLDFDKATFCEMVKVAGLHEWVARVDQWKRMEKADIELTEKMAYKAANDRLEELRREQKALEAFVSNNPGLHRK